MYLYKYITIVIKLFSILIEYILLMLYFIKYIILNYLYI